MPYLYGRDPLADAKDTLSSWDKCMAKSYCKWPVIVAIVVGSLIILSVVLCVARCICCGAEVACCCFKCCTCCCGGRGSSSGHKRVKSEPPPPPPMYPSSYAAAPTPPAPAPIDTRPINQQYRSHDAPVFNAVPERPQFATFDSPSKPVNEDALPAMPSWKDARSRQVEEEVIPEKHGDMEMDRLDHNGSMTGTSISGATSGAAAIGTARRSPGPGRSPIQRSPTQDSYGFPPGYQNDSFVSGAPQRSPHNSPGPYGRPYGQQQEGYRGVSPVQQQSLSPVYGAGAGYAQNQQYGRRSPNQGYNQYNQSGPRHSPSPPSSNGYGYGAPSPSREYVDMPHTDNYAPAPAPAPVRVNSPGYAPSGSTRYEPPAAAYPGQQTYQSSEASYPGQQTYQAFQPAEPQGQQYSPVSRKPMDGSWKEV